MAPTHRRNDAIETGPIRSEMRHATIPALLAMKEFCRSTGSYKNRGSLRSTSFYSIRIDSGRRMDALSGLPPRGRLQMTKGERAIHDIADRTTAFEGIRSTACGNWSRRFGHPRRSLSGPWQRYAIGQVEDLAKSDPATTEKTSPVKSNEPFVVRQSMRGSEGLPGKLRRRSTQGRIDPMTSIRSRVDPQTADVPQVKASRAAGNVTCRFDVVLTIIDPDILTHIPIWQGNAASTMARHGCSRAVLTAEIPNTNYK